jgi:hypothetical protein
MRYILSTCALFIAITTLGQKPYTREQVVEVDTATSAEVLRGKARLWFVDTFKDAKEVIQMDDAATNTIVGKGWQELMGGDKMLVTIEVIAKQGRCRIRIYDVVHRWKDESSTLHWGTLYDEDLCYNPPTMPMISRNQLEKQALKNCGKYRPIISSNLDRLMQSFTDAMKAPASDDW